MKIQRHLSPTSAPLSALDLCRGIAAFISPEASRNRLTTEIQEYFGVSHAFLLTSGKAALTVLFMGLSIGTTRRKVIIPAYTCFSVPSSVLRAGLEIVLCDVDPQTLDYDFSDLEQTIDDQTLAIVSTHLLGQPANVEKVKDLAKKFGAYVIEDSAQAMGGVSRGKRSETQGDAAIFSCGRGKNISSGSGGVIITKSDKVAESVGRIYRQLPFPSIWGSIKNLLVVMATTLFLHPRLYWFPVGLPFLKLGETVFEENFPLYRMDGPRAGLLKFWRRRLMISNRHREEAVEYYERRLRMQSHDHQLKWVPAVPYLRFPYLLPSMDQKEGIVRIARTRGLGVTALYPSSISEISQLRDRFSGRRFPGARKLSECLVTLPTHPFVLSADIEQIVSLFQSQVPRQEEASDLPGVSANQAGRFIH